MIFSVRLYCFLTAGRRLAHVVGPMSLQGLGCAKTKSDLVRLCDRARRSRNAAPSRLTPSPAPIARVEQDTFLSEHGGEAAADFFKNVLVGSMLALAPSF